MFKTPKKKKFSLWWVFNFFGDFNTFPSWAFPRRSFSLFPSSYLSFPPLLLLLLSLLPRIACEERKCKGSVLTKAWGILEVGASPQKYKSKSEFRREDSFPRTASDGWGKKRKSELRWRRSAGDYLWGQVRSWEKDNTNIMEFVSTQAIKNNKKYFPMLPWK